MLAVQTPCPDEFHAAWQCPLVAQQAPVSELQDAPLVAEAFVCATQRPALWLRGLSSDLYQGVPEPLDQCEVHAWPAEPWLPGRYFTDASGGTWSADPRLRSRSGAPRGCRCLRLLLLVPCLGNCRLSAGVSCLLWLS